MILVGILGAKGSGKSTIAQHLKEQHRFVRYSMASVLKDMLRAAGLKEEHIHGSLKETPQDILCGKTPRWAMQSLGDEWGRQQIGQDLWVRLAEANLQEVVRQLTILRRGEAGEIAVVIDNIRYPNELEMVRRQQGQLFLVRRPSVEPRKRWLRKEHASETLWRKAEADFTVFNDGSKDSLLAQVDFKLGL